MTWVLAASDTKDAQTLLGPLLKNGDSVHIVEFGPVAGMPWVHPMATDKLAEAALAVADVELRVHGSDIRSALTAASVNAAPDRMLVVAGSLYLVGDVLRSLRDQVDEARVEEAENDEVGAASHSHEGG